MKSTLVPMTFESKFFFTRFIDNLEKQDSKFSFLEQKLFCIGVTVCLHYLKNQLAYFFQICIVIALEHNEELMRFL